MSTREPVEDGMARRSVRDTAGERTSELAGRLLSPLGDRWQHTKGVAARTREVSWLLTQADGAALIAAAYLHDIGYAPQLRQTGFHPLDGARFLQARGYERLACLVAHHTGAGVEAEELGLGNELAEFAQEHSLVAKLLTYCDLITAPNGSRVCAEERLAEIIQRYGDAAPARAARRSAPLLLADVRFTERTLRGVDRRR